MITFLSIYRFRDVMITSMFVSLFRVRNYLCCYGNHHISVRNFRLRSVMQFCGNKKQHQVFCKATLKYMFVNFFESSMIYRQTAMSIQESCWNFFSIHNNWLISTKFWLAVLLNICLVTYTWKSRIQMHVIYILLCKLNWCI